MSMMFTIVAALFASQVAGSAPTTRPASAGPVGVPGEWTLSFHDEFEGTALNREKWNDQWREFNADGEIFYQPYRFLAVNLPENLTVADGVLTIRANREPIEWDPKVKFTTGGINSAEKFSQRYGYFEVRLKAPDAGARGTDADFFLFCEANRWPPELDVCEIPGSGQARRVLMNQHFVRPEGGRGSNEKYHVLENDSFADGFHTFGLLWAPDRLVWYVDGVERHRSTTHVPDVPMVLFCALEIPGDWTGDPSTGQWPQQMQVDYIRVYQRSPDAAASQSK